MAGIFDRSFVIGGCLGARMMIDRARGFVPVSAEVGFVRRRFDNLNSEVVVSTSK